MTSILRSALVGVPRRGPLGLPLTVPEDGQQLRDTVSAFGSFHQLGRWGAESPGREKMPEGGAQGAPCGLRWV